MKALLAAAILLLPSARSMALSSESAALHARQQARTESIPLTVGTRWTYLAHTTFTSVGDTSGEGCADTIVVQIADTATHVAQKRPATHWSVRGSALCIGLLARQPGLWVTGTTNSGSIRDTLAFHGSPTDSTPKFILTFPLRVGAVWACKRCWLLDLPSRFETEVKSVEDVLTPAGEFKDVFHIVSRGWVRIPPNDINLNGLIVTAPGGPDQKAVVEYWIKPGVGIVKLLQTVEVEWGGWKKLVFEWNLLSWKAALSTED